MFEMTISEKKNEGSVEERRKVQRRRSVDKAIVGNETRGNDDKGRQRYTDRVSKLSDLDVMDDVTLGFGP